MTSSLLLTKLYCPSLHPKRLKRPHLIHRLNEGLEAGRPITLVSAPAGSGKTTCIIEWLDTLDLPVAWLSLDASDDDPGRFYTYLVAALQKVNENLGREIGGVLGSGQLPPVDVISTTLINDILDFEGQFLLVLDDFQVIQDRFILQVLEGLVANLPQPLHLVLLTREDPPLPLARLRANNQLTEIRARDLRFARHEAERFLNEVMGLSLSQADITALDDKTEGWIVGLQLAGLSVRDRANPSSFIATLSGSHRSILGYLTEEVLSQQPEEIRILLLQTSILDRLCGDLCNAVTGRTDGHLLLEQLFNANLFLIPLDDEQRWYRYHHLFSDLLRDLQKALQKNKTDELHQRASHWYAQADMASEAIHHALVAKDYAMAVQLLERHVMDMLMQWHVKTVDRFLQEIPPQLSMQNSRVNLAFAWMYLLRGDYAQASPYVERLQAIFSSSQMDEMDISLQAEWLALQAMLLNAQAKPVESLDLADQALEIVPEKDVYVRSLIYMGLASAHQQLDDYGQAVEAFQRLIQYGRAAASLVSEMLGLSGLARMAIQRGQLHFAFEIASQGVDRVERSGSLSTAVYGELGVVYYHWYQIEQAHTHFQRAIQVSTLSGYIDAEIYYAVILSRLLQMEGDLEASAREIHRAVDLMQVDGRAQIRGEVISQQVRVDLAQNRVAAAEMALQGEGFSHKGEFSIPDLAPDQKISEPDGLLYNSALRILLYQAQTRREPSSLRSGIELADRLIAETLRRQYIPIALETLLLCAQMHAVLGNDQASLANVVRALELAEPEGFITIFVEEGLTIAETLAALLKQGKPWTVQPDYIKAVLDAFPREAQPMSISTSPVAELAALGDEIIEPLTQRELEILRLIREGYSNQEIAERLVITLHTVKKHSSNIYSKLGVNNRTQAVARARQLGLV